MYILIEFTRDSEGKWKTLREIQKVKIAEIR